VFAALTYANLNTVLGDYLPGVLTINSHVPGFDINNINNNKLFSINSSTQTHGYADEAKVVDRNSSLAKLMLNSFDNLLAFVKPGQTMYVKLSDKPRFTLANYYYVA